MNTTRCVIFYLFGAFAASAWWACAMFSRVENNDTMLLLIPAVILSLGTIAVAGYATYESWNK